MNKKNLIELTKDYHYEVCNTKTGCIEFETADNRKFIDLNYEASLGVAYNSFHDEELALWGIGWIGNWAPTASFIATLSSKRFSKYLAIQGGFTISNLDVHQSKNEKYGPLDFKMHSVTTDFQVGGIWWITQTGVQPYLKLGFTFQHFWSVSGKFKFNKEYPSRIVEPYERNLHSAFHVNYPGFYITPGLNIPIGDQAIFIEFCYKGRKRDYTKTRSLEAHVGYRF